MKKLLFLLIPCTAFGAGTGICPSGYTAITESNVIITEGSCPSGYTSVGTVTNCRSTSPGGNCMAPDWAYKLHAGSQATALYSEKFTNPSLVVKIDGTEYYGDMTTAAKGKLRINMNNTTYSVYDASL